MDFKIRPLETKKSKIPLRGPMKIGVIPKPNTTSFICGRTGSGKSQLLLNLMTRPEFYGKKNGKHYFQEIHVFSPTAKSDDIYNFLELPDQNLHVDLNTEELRTIMDSQKEDIEKKGIDKCKRICIIYDDVQGNPKFLRSPQFRESIIANRHINASVFILGQSYKHIPRQVRLQCRYIFYFQGSNNERNVIVDEICAPGLSRDDMAAVVDFATEGSFDFLFVNLNEPFKRRYRKNLTEIIDIYGDLDEEEEKNKS
jgi:hypothetical protein